MKFFSNNSNKLGKLLPADYKRVLCIVLITTLGTFLVASVSYTLTDNSAAPVSDMFRQWDALRYLAVAEKGYQSAIASDTSLIPVLPLYPALISAGSFLTGSPMVAAVVISNSALAVASIYLYRIVRIDDKGGMAPVYAVLFLSIFPTSYFLRTAYTESLFLSLVIPSFYYARKGNWVLSGALGMFSTAVRITGLAAFAGLLFEYLYQNKFRAKSLFRKDFLAVCVVPLGFLVYVYLNYQLLGDPLYFVKVQGDYFGRHVASFWEGLRNAFVFTYSKMPGEQITLGYSEAFAGIIGMFASLFAFKVRPSYGVYSILALFTVTFNSFWIGTPRYLLSIFPLFILMGRVGEKSELMRFVMVFLSLTLLTIFLSLFVQGKWAF